MTHAYDELYLDKARIALGRMLDFAVHDLGYGLTDFFDLFLSTGTATRFGQGDISLLVGRSGVELCYAVLGASGIAHPDIAPSYTSNRSPEYWTGWALAYYQWSRGLSFKQITQSIPVDVICGLYSPYHEMDIRQFADKMDDLYRQAKVQSNLKSLRLRASLTQQELAHRSKVPLRTIQQYEQRQKNINKAQAETILSLAKALCCDVRDLIEFL